MRLNAQAEQKASQSRGKVPSTGTAYPSGIAIKGEDGRKNRGAQEGDHSIQSGLGMKSVMGLSREQDGGACIDKIEHLDHMLLLAFGVGRDRGGILKIHLDLLKWFTRLERLVRALRGSQDIPKFAQDFPDGACRSRRDNPLCGQISIAMQII